MAPVDNRHLTDEAEATAVRELAQKLEAAETREEKRNILRQLSERILSLAVDLGEPIDSLTELP